MGLASYVEGISSYGIVYRFQRIAARTCPDTPAPARKGFGVFFAGILLSRQLVGICPGKLQRWPELKVEPVKYRIPSGDSGFSILLFLAKKY
jgi:hypothetical protein